MLPLAGRQSYLAVFCHAIGDIIIARFENDRSKLHRSSISSLVFRMGIKRLLQFYFTA